MSTAVQRRTRYKFRLLHGAHHERDPITGKTMTWRATATHKPIIHTNCDLSLHNQRGSQKFERVSDDFEEPEKDSPQNVIPANDTLESMTDEELRRYAEEEEIDLGKLKARDQILKKIRESLA